MVAWVGTLNYFAYGTTEAEARESAEQGLNALIQSFENEDEWLEYLSMCRKRWNSHDQTVNSHDQTDVIHVKP